MDKLQLDELINRCRKKDEKAFRLILEHFQTMVYSLAFRLLCDESEAEDVTQETFIRVWINLKKYDVQKKFSTWIYTIATNLCLDKLRYRRHFLLKEISEQDLKILITQEDIERDYIHEELAAIISAFSNDLTPKQKLVFTLRYLEDLTVDEIVEITGLTPEKIKSNLFLARKEIRRKIEKITQ